MQHCDAASGRIEADTIGDTTVSDGVVGQDHRDSTLAVFGLPQRDPAFAVLDQPMNPFKIRHLTGYGGPQIGSRHLMLAKRTRTRRQPAIQLGHDHLQGQVEWIKSAAAVPPTFATSAAA